MQIKHTVRSAYSKKTPITISKWGEGRTKQSHKDETDINAIMKRFEKTGMVDFITTHEPKYGEITALDFRESMQNVAQANEMFADLPAKVRDRFENDPAELLEFLDNPANREEAVLLGLVEPQKEPNPATPVPGKEKHRRASDEPEATSKATE